MALGRTLSLMAVTAPDRM
ncbi:MAG: hypothetical protein MUP15_02780 [Dehalococcoidia bacterium]|nr:hypothetical protein [Dehalococcoidia bacterium]